MGLTTTDDGRVILSPVSWEAYECLLKNYENQSSVRIAYDNGKIEIMSPLVKHEKDNRALQDIVTTILDTWQWEFMNAGSATFKKNSAAKGFEPDTCFYIQSVGSVLHKDDIDIEQGDPPPDLVIEINLTASSLDRDPIFAAIGVPEVWRYAKDHLTILTLTGETYVSQEESTALPGIKATQLDEWLTARSTVRRHLWIQQIRTWAEANQKPV